MQSNQPRVEEVSSNNIIERELQPPKPTKHKKKKVSFAVWWELYAPEELKISADNIKQQDASLVVEKELTAKAQETVDQKGDRPTPESESNERNQVPFKTWSEEHVPIDQEISAGNIEKQNDSLVSVEESIARVQETNEIEKEQPSKSQEQPPKTRKNKKKKIPFKIWLEKQASADLIISAEGTATEDVSPATETASISLLQETIDIAEKEESFKSSAQNVNEQDTSLPEEGGDQEDSLKKQIFTKETPLVTEPELIPKAQETLEQQDDELLLVPPTTRRRKKKIPFHIWLEKQASADLRVSSESSGPQDASTVANQESITVVQETAEKEESFGSWAQSVIDQDTCLPEEGGDQEDSLKKEICGKETPLVTKPDLISKAQERLNQQDDELLLVPLTTRHHKKKMIPFNIWLEKPVSSDLRVSFESSGPQDASIVANQESITVVQETAEKEESFGSWAQSVNDQDTCLPEEGGDQEDSLKKEICTKETPLVTEPELIAKAEERLEQQDDELLFVPPTTRRRKKKKVPFHIWLEKQASGDLRVSESSGPQDASTVANQESITVVQETAEKEEFFGSWAQSVIDQDTCLPEEGGDQEDSLKKEICGKETPLVTEPDLISKAQETLEQQDDELLLVPPTTRRRKKKKIPFHIWLERQASAELKVSSESSGLEDPSIAAKQESIAVVQETAEKKQSFMSCSENVSEQDTSLPQEGGDQEDSLKKKSCREEPVILASLEKQCYSKDPVISTSSQAKCACQTTSKEPELGSIELQRYLMRQLDEMFDVNRKLNAKLKYYQDQLRKVHSEQGQNRKSTGWGHKWVE